MKETYTFKMLAASGPSFKAVGEDMFDAPDDNSAIRDVRSRFLTPWPENVASAHLFIGDRVIDIERLDA